MAYIQLFNGRRFLGDFALPQNVCGIGGNTFRLVYAVKGGGNGIVFDSRRLDDAGRVIGSCAVKFLKQQDKTRIDRFINEIRILSSLHHDRIATHFDSGEIVLEDDIRVPWVAMELGGDNLRQNVAMHGAIPVDTLKQIGLDICDALIQLHAESIIHRDIKPDNFVWDPVVDGRVKMIDFGIAKYIGEDTSLRPLDEFTQHLEFVGPVFFSSPELIAYASDKMLPVDHRSDLFQLGKVLWFLGTAKISAGVPSKKDCPLGGKLRDLVLELVSDRPEDRLQSAQEVKDILIGL
ncbi:MAG: serine/threonine protein kinase [Planctomycetaceae bacterium]|nr:serine/threonine protein kinase [Planctomycetaceae bacterium]